MLASCDVLKVNPSPHSLTGTYVTCAFSAVNPVSSILASHLISSEKYSLLAEESAVPFTGSARSELEPLVLI